MLLSYPVYSESDKFQICILKHEGNYNPHPGAAADVLKYMASTTSVDPPEKPVYLSVSEKILAYPFLYITAKGRLPVFSRTGMEILSKHINSGGFMLIDEAGDYGAGDFYNSVREFAASLFPEAALTKIPPDDVIFKAFYLKPKVSGTNIVSTSLYGVRQGSRWALVYSRNDLLGVWARDEMGRFLYPCRPGGEAQRMEAIKLTVNIIMYSLTGTYKQDIIHRNFIERKLKSW